MATASSHTRLSLTSTSRVDSLPPPPHNPSGVRFFSCKGFFFDSNPQTCYPCYASTSSRCSLCWIEWKKPKPSLNNKHRKFTRGIIRASSSDESSAVNGAATQTNSTSAVEQMRIKLDQVLENDDLSNGIVQAIYDAARAIELAFLERSSVKKSNWFSRSWLGADRFAWSKSLSYQAAIDSLLRAAIEISSRGDGRDRDVNVFVQRSLSRLRAPLETEIQDQILRKQPGAYDWYLSNQIPLVVTTFVNFFEKDIRFSAATAICNKEEMISSPNTTEVSLLMLSLSCLAAITKLGPAKTSCQPFISIVPETIGRFMDMLLDFVKINEAYQSLKDIGLNREFLYHFGIRVATVRFIDDQNFINEIKFWVDVIQKKLQRAISREKIWSRLTTCESIEVLEKDLAIFGFFIALGRNTQSYLSSNGFTIADDSLDGVVRYLIGGSVLYYPQLSSISSYQLYVEVVCEELEWLPFYGNDILLSSKLSPHGHGNKEKVMAPKEVKLRILAVCLYWMMNFTKHSVWLQNPSNVKAMSFLTKGEEMLSDCMKELGVSKDMIFNTMKQQMQTVPQGKMSIKSNLDSIDEALESVETALVRLEDLLQELHVSGSNPGNKEQLQAACSDLERIRRLKKQAEFLEASFRAKVDADSGLSSTTELANKSAARKSRYFWGFLIRNRLLSEPEEQDLVQNNGASKEDYQRSEANDIHRIEKLTNELMELEKRVQRSTDDSDNYLDGDILEGRDNKADQLSSVPSRKENVLVKSVEKLKETTTDVLQGTQLLAIDVAAATELLRRSVTGDELTEKEKKALQRTLTDLASVIPIGILMLLPRTLTDLAFVIPIGILMLLPLTAVGHAAILAFIQRYVPSLIPSTYAPERLDLLRQLEKVKEMEISSDSEGIKEPETVR